MITFGNCITLSSIKLYIIIKISENCLNRVFLNKELSALKSPIPE